MLPIALVALVALASGSRAASPDAAADRFPPTAEEDAEPDRRDPCRGREGWVGDGEDGRDPPACDGPGPAEPDPEAEGLHTPDWLRRPEDGDADEDEDGGYDR